MKTESQLVPKGLAVSAAWSWRLLIVGLALLVLFKISQMFMLLVLPIFIALLVASIARPIVNKLTQLKIPRPLASLLVLLGTIGVIFMMGYFITQQIIANSSELAHKVSQGLKEIQVWLVEGPLQLTDSQISEILVEAQGFVQNQPEVWIERAMSISGTLGSIFAGFFLFLFAYYFFLSDGARIFHWMVNLFPKDSRDTVNASGRIAWKSLSQFTKATALIAVIDSIGIMLVAWALDVPFVIPIGILVFLGAFIPMVGAVFSGIIAVLLALVAQGPLVALFMFIGVIAVQQIEGNFLQPFLMGKIVSLHPLAVLLTVAAGFTVAGIPGALVFVPLVASVNSVAKYLSKTSNELEDLEDEELELVEVVVE